MAEQVRVDDLDVFRTLRGAVLKFAQAANQSLLNADAQGARMMTWLEVEQTAFWQGQLRKRTDAVSRAQEAVRQKKLFRDAAGRMPSAVEEEKHLAKCKAAVEQAQEKILAIRKAIPRLQKEIEAFRGGVAGLSGMLAGEIPKAIAMLDALAARIEEYIQLTTPSGEPSAAAPIGGEEFAASTPPPDSPMTRPAQEQENANAETRITNQPQSPNAEGANENPAGEAPQQQREPK
jgi:hypothetical protein